MHIKPIGFMCIDFLLVNRSISCIHLNIWSFWNCYFMKAICQDSQGKKRTISSDSQGYSTLWPYFHFMIKMNQLCSTGWPTKNYSFFRGRYLGPLISHKTCSIPNIGFYQILIFMSSIDLQKFFPNIFYVKHKSTKITLSLLFTKF